jgi:GDPmannose 4,6-dehydratase
MKKRALIIGVGGQDGAYLSKHLLNKNYDVCGTSRDSEGRTFENLESLDVLKRLKIVTLDPGELHNVLAIIGDYLPHEIYFLSAQSSVGLSFKLPFETFNSSVVSGLNILESCRILDNNARMFFACSSECFGDIGDLKANESTKFSPKSPYAVAKCSLYWLVKTYRESYGLYACCGLLFNHESPLRHERYVTSKIINTAKRIKNGSDEVLTLGNIDVYRDWGYAPEYVDAFYLMLNVDKADDFIIATGQMNSLRSFVEYCFDRLDLDCYEHIKIDPSLFRPNELVRSYGDPSKAERELNWKPKFYMRDVIDKCLFF